MTWLKDILTDDKGNFTPDKVALVSGIATYLGVMVGAAIAHPELVWPNALQFGGGLGAVLACGGGAMWAASRQKTTTQPGDPQ